MLSLATEVLDWIRFIWVSDPAYIVASLTRPATLVVIAQVEYVTEKGDVRRQRLAHDLDFPLSATPTELSFEQWLGLY